METAGTKPNRNATKNNNTQMAKQLNTYKGKYINLALVRVAKPEKILLDPELGMHLNFARHCQTRTLYILAAGYNAKLASKLTKRIAKELKFKVDFEDVYKAKYKGSLTDIYCGRLSY